MSAKPEDKCRCGDIRRYHRLRRGEDSMMRIRQLRTGPCTQCPCQQFEEA